MANKKYSPAQQRLGALDVNDDILKYEYEKLIEENKKIVVENTLRKKEIESLKKTIEALEKKYKKLQLANDLLKKAAEKRGDDDNCDDRFDFKSYFAKYIKSGTQDGFNKEMVRLLSDKKILLNARKMGLTRGLAGPMRKERVNKIKGMLAKNIGRGFLMD
jgi:hypothetical protein